MASLQSSLFFQSPTGLAIQGPPIDGLPVLVADLSQWEVANGIPLKQVAPPSPNEANKGGYINETYWGSRTVSNTLNCLLIVSVISFVVLACLMVTPAAPLAGMLLGYKITILCGVIMLPAAGMCLARYNVLKAQKKARENEELHRRASSPTTDNGYLLYPVGRPLVLPISPSARTTKAPIAASTNTDQEASTNTDQDLPSGYWDEHYSAAAMTQAMEAIALDSDEPL